MHKGKKSGIQIPNQNRPTAQTKIPTISLLDSMIDGREFESLLKFQKVNVNIQDELKKAIKDISNLRNRPVIVYMSNVVNSNVRAVTSIEYGDDLPFSELINSVPIEEKNIDIILVTPGGSGTQVAKFVDKLRPRFENVSFIIPDIAMSAGTILSLSGDEIIMTNNSYIGPIDPQVPNKDGVYYPAQAILTLIEEIKLKGEIALKMGQSPEWTDLQILRQIDPKEIGHAITASKYSVELVENYLKDYKFKTWEIHSNGQKVTEDEKKKRASEIANQLCNHSLWKSHGRGIKRDVAWDICRLKITHSEDIDIDRVIKRFWALSYWIFENTPIFKIFLSEDYNLMRNDLSLIKPKI